MSFGNTRLLVLPAPPDHLSRVMSLRNLQALDRPNGIDRSPASGEFQ